MSQQALRNRYVQDSIQTASPARLLVMLYDRLVRDLNQAEQGIVAGDAALAHANLLHAQEIVIELRASLDADAWEGGPRLASLYAFLLSELIGANVAKDAARVVACRSLVEPLRDAWSQALTAQAVAR